jgi:hypothetical protein
MSADQSTDRAIKLVQALMNEKPWCDQQWARAALAIAASAIKRGCLWSEDEKLENLAKAMEEDDPEWTPAERAANHETAERLRKMISKGASVEGKT